jgi:hypothetical protein
VDTGLSDEAAVVSTTVAEDNVDHDELTIRFLVGV